jgi:hypothetical protein
LKSSSATWANAAEKLVADEEPDCGLRRSEAEAPPAAAAGELCSEA